MDWPFSQGYAFAVNVLGAVLCGVLFWLVARIKAHMPATGSWFARVKSGARQSPVVSGIVGVTLLACVGVFIAGYVVGPEKPVTAGATPAFTAAPAEAVKEESEPLTLARWGPERALFSASNRPTAATLNSVFDTDEYGYEPNFLSIKPSDGDEGSYGSSVVAQPGQSYTVAVAVHNDATAGGEAVEGVRLRVQMPGVAKGSAPAYGFLSASNTSPAEILDGATLVGEDPDHEFAIRYVTDSAVVHTQGAADGMHLGDELFTDGAAIGCDALDGIIPAEQRCAIWVTYEVRIDQPNFEAAAVAKMKGSDTWSSSYVAKSGDKVTVAVTYKNTGTTQQDDVVLRVQLPQNAQFVSGSATWRNASAERDMDAGDGLVERGINLGSYAPGANAWAQFEMVVQDSEGDQSLQEVPDFFTVETNNGSKSAPLTLVWLG